jgi:hypothetical protein
MKQMPPIPVVPSPSIAVQAIPEVVLLRDRIERIVDDLKWIKKPVCVHSCSCCSICSTNEVDGSVMYYYLYDDLAEVSI